MKRDGNDIFLEPADFYWGNAPERIHTVLGSCISLTIWNPVKKTGGMCHFLLPRVLRDDANEIAGRYCEDAVRVLMDSVRKEGMRLATYEVKIFGGAAMFDNTTAAIGVNNIKCAEEMALLHGFSIKARHVGGKCSRHIIFELASGDVWVKTNNGVLISEEKMEQIDYLEKKTDIAIKRPRLLHGVKYGKDQSSDR